MCGINAVINHPDYSISEQLSSKMHQATKHRGTKGVPEYRNNASTKFNWLRITDESLFVMPNEYNGTIVYMNGFISNFKELAEKYNITLKTNCDIEFLAKFIDMHNGNKLDELNGFFAIMYWSTFYKDWFFVTDRYGIKQLYTYTENGVTFVSSEVKGILAVCPEIKPSMDAVEDWKTTLGVLNDDTIYSGIKRVKKLPFIIPEKINISYDDAKNQLIGLLNQSFERNKYIGKSGVYLSGGIDSGIIAKWMNPEYCFSVDYVDENFSESDLIKKNSVSAHLSLMVNQEMAKKYSLLTMNALDDFKAGSCYTNFAIAELASNFVKVVYSGAGGDEFFGGYPHRNNKPIENVIARTNYALANINKLPDNWNVSHFEYDLKFLAAVLVVEDRMSAYHTMETRYPLLDNDLVNFALSLPDEYVENKKILKDVCGLHPDVVNGKKKGFSNPYFTNDDWVDFTLNNLTR
jgi:asparagine synthase (glutamine-hydrolysing)